MSALSLGIPIGCLLGRCALSMPGADTSTTVSASRLRPASSSGKSPAADPVAASHPEPQEHADDDDDVMELNFCSDSAAQSVRKLVNEVGIGRAQLQQLNDTNLYKGKRIKARKIEPSSLVRCHIC